MHVLKHTFSDTSSELLVYDTLNIPPTGAGGVIDHDNAIKMNKPDGIMTGVVLLVGRLLPAGLIAVTLHTY